MRSTAAVTEERGAPFRIQDVDVDDPRPGEVRVEMVACGVATDAGEVVEPVLRLDR